MKGGRNHEERKVSVHLGRGPRVRPDLCGADSDVYKAVKELKIGDKIDMEGFLYWYEGVNPHITSVTKVVAE